MILAGASTAEAAPQAPDKLAHLSEMTVTATQQDDGVAMLSWAPSVGIVDQLQTIHRLSQLDTPEAVNGLIAALNSPYPLARRKASASLLDRAHAQPEAQTRQWVSRLTPTLRDTDCIVRNTVVRLMATVRTPESAACLKSFFHAADKSSQMEALDALTQADTLTPDVVALIRQASPFGEIRQAISKP